MKVKRPLTSRKTQNKITLAFIYIAYFGAFNHRRGAQHVDPSEKSRNKQSQGATFSAPQTGPTGAEGAEGAGGQGGLGGWPLGAKCFYFWFLRRSGRSIRRF